MSLDHKSFTENVFKRNDFSSSYIPTYHPRSHRFFYFLVLFYDIIIKELYIHFRVFCLHFVINVPILSSSFSSLLFHFSVCICSCIEIIFISFHVVSFTKWTKNVFGCVREFEWDDDLYSSFTWLCFYLFFVWLLYCN